MSTLDDILEDIGEVSEQTVTFYIEVTKQVAQYEPVKVGAVMKMNLPDGTTAEDALKLQAEFQKRMIETSEAVASNLVKEANRQAVIQENEERVTTIEAVINGGKQAPMPRTTSQAPELNTQQGTNPQVVNPLQDRSTARDWGFLNQKPSARELNHGDIMCILCESAVFDDQGNLKLKPLGSRYTIEVKPSSFLYNNFSSAIAAAGGNAYTGKYVLSMRCSEVGKQTNAGNPWLNPTDLSTLADFSANNSLNGITESDFRSVRVASSELIIL